MSAVEVRVKMVVVDKDNYKVKLSLTACNNNDGVRFKEEFPDGFIHYWYFTNLLEALRFQSKLTKQCNLENPLETIVNE